MTRFYDRGRLNKAFVVCGVLLVWTAIAAPLNHDEGWLLYAGRAVYRGQMLYRDFAHVKPPLAAYIYGLPQAMLGSSIMGHPVMIGRITTLLINLASLGLVWELAHKHARNKALAQELAPALALCLTVYIHAFGEARTEPLTTLLALAALLSLNRPMLATALAIAASATRLSNIPFAILIASASACRARSWRLAGLALIELPVLYLPAILSPRHAAFSLITMQRWTDHQLTRPYSPTWLHGAGQVMGLLATILVATGFIALIRSCYGRCQQTEQLSFITLAGAVLFCPNLTAPDPTPAYLIPACTIAAVPVTCLLADGYRRLCIPRRVLALWNRVFCRANPPRRIRYSTGLVPLALAIPTFYRLLHPTPHPSLASLAPAARIVNQVVPSGEKLALWNKYPTGQPPSNQYSTGLATFNVYLALEAGRVLPRGFEMDTIAFYPYLDDESCQRFGVLNERLFYQVIAGRAVAITDFDLGLVFYHHRAAHHAPNNYHLLARLDHHVLVATVSPFGQWGDTLYILLPAGLSGLGHRPPSVSKPSSRGTPSTSGTRMGSETSGRGCQGGSREERGDHARRHRGYPQRASGRAVLAGCHPGA